MPRHKQSFVNIRVDAGEQIQIGEAIFTFESHATTGRVYSQAGARGWIYKLREVSSGDSYALKVFAHLFRGDGILQVQAALDEEVALGLPGMAVARRGIAGGRDTSGIHHRVPGCRPQHADALD